MRRLPRFPMQNSNNFPPVEATQTKVNKPADHSDISTGHLEALPRAIKHPSTSFYQVLLVLMHHFIDCIKVQHLFYRIENKQMFFFKMNVLLFRSQSYLFHKQFKRSSTTLLNKPPPALSKQIGLAEKVRWSGLDGVRPGWKNSFEI